MKQTADLDRYQRNMLPGIITLEGMLGTDTRKLGDILSADHNAVRSLKTTHRTIAARMRLLREHGAEGLGLDVHAADHFHVRVDNVRGKLPCPFEDGIFQKTFIIVHNDRLDKTIRYTDLHIHMIEAHGFYEGRGSHFRLEPADLVEVLEIEAEPDNQFPPSDD